jgi:hypothetical protein
MGGITAENTSERRSTLARQHSRRLIIDCLALLLYSLLELFLPSASPLAFAPATTPSAPAPCDELPVVVTVDGGMGDSDEDDGVLVLDELRWPPLPSAPPPTPDAAPLRLATCSALHGTRMSLWHFLCMRSLHDVHLKPWRPRPQMRSWQNAQKALWKKRRRKRTRWGEKNKL